MQATMMSKVKPILENKLMNIATISAGFEKGDFLVRKEQGNRMYFDFFEEAFNYISNKGCACMSQEDEKHWVDLMNVIHNSVKGGMKYNTSTLLMVLSWLVSNNPTVPTKKLENPPKKMQTPSKVETKSLNL